MLQGEQVYSVKWYKGGLEIFRHLPSAAEQQTTCFPRPGVTIDEVSASLYLELVMLADNCPDTVQMDHCMHNHNHCPSAQLQHCNPTLSNLSI